MTDNQIITIVTAFFIFAPLILIVKKIVKETLSRKILLCFLSLNALLIAVSLMNPFGLYDVSWYAYMLYLLFITSLTIGFLFSFSKRKENYHVENTIDSLQERITNLFKSKKWRIFSLVTLAIQIYYAIRFLIFAKDYENGMLARQAFYSDFFINGLEYFFYHFIVTTARKIIIITSIFYLYNGKYRSIWSYIGIIIVVATALTGFGRMAIVEFILYYLFFVIVIRKKRKKIQWRKIVIPATSIIALTILSLFLIGNRTQKQNILSTFLYQTESMVEYYTVGFRNLDIYLKNGFKDLEPPTIIRGTFAGVEEIVTIPIVHFTNWTGTFNRTIAPQTQTNNVVGITADGKNIIMNAFYTAIMPLYNDIWALGVVFYAIIFGLYLSWVVKKFTEKKSISSLILLTFFMVEILSTTTYRWAPQSAQITFTLILLSILVMRKIPKNKDKVLEKGYMDDNKTKINIINQTIKRTGPPSGRENRILWTTNTIMPYPAQQLGKKPTVFGGWLNGLFNEIIKNKKYTLGIASIYDGKTLKKFYDNKVTYYLVPCKNDTVYQPGMEKSWQKIVEDFQPDLIHLHGTEYAHNLSLQKACPEKKYLVAIQGLLGPCAKVYMAGLSKNEIKKNMTVIDHLTGGIIGGQKSFEKRAKYEKQILKKATAIVGRTQWDYDESLKIAGDKPYFKCNEILRNAFYDQNWNIQNTEPYSIYVSQASYPIKGFHILLDALPDLVKKYPDIKVYVGGIDITDRSNFKKKIMYSGYAKILMNKIKNNNLEKHIIFLGEIPEENVLRHMKKCNVFVQCSSIENSSNSLGEAMLIGMPCVASNVGGTQDLLIDKKEGLLYNFNDTETLAKYIDKVFSDDKFASALGKSAQKHAKITHNKQKNSKTMLKIYEKIINEN